MMEKYGNLNVINHNFYGGSSGAHARSPRSDVAIATCHGDSIYTHSSCRCEGNSEKASFKINGILSLPRGKFLRLFTFHHATLRHRMNRKTSAKITLPCTKRSKKKRKAKENTMRRKISMFTIADTSVCTINKPSEEHKKTGRESLYDAVKNEELAQ